MPNKSRPTFKKRQRELDKQQKQRDKRARRLEKKERAAHAPQRTGDEDPDIAGIRPGPQPLPGDEYGVPAPDRQNDPGDVD